MPSSTSNLARRARSDGTRLERARSAGSAPLQGAQCRARALSPGIPPRPAPGVFPAATGCNESRPASLAHSTTAGRSRSPTAMGRGASLRHGSLSARWHPSALERAVECRRGAGAREPGARDFARSRAPSVESRDAGRFPEAHDAGTTPLRRGSGAAGVAWSRSGGRRDGRASIEAMIDGTVKWHHSHSTRIVCPRPERARSARGCALTGRTTTPSPGSQPGSHSRRAGLHQDAHGFLPTTAPRFTRPTAPPRTGRYSPRLTRRIPPCRPRGSNTDVVFLSGVRTGFGGFGGTLKDLSATELGAVAAKHALQRSGGPAGDIALTVSGHLLQTTA